MLELKKKKKLELKNKKQNQTERAGTQHQNGGKIVHRI